MAKNPERWEVALTEEQRATLIRLTERYCVVLQTIRAAPPVVTTAG